MFMLDNYRVSFKHSQFSGDTRKGITVCYIANQAENVTIVIELAYCSCSDNFNKAIGRKVALTRALKAFDKATRKRFWNAYFEAQGGVK